MIFNYSKEYNGHDYCPNCGRKFLFTESEREDVSISLDSLPNGHEKEALIDSFRYCPDCGAVWTVFSTPLNLYHEHGFVTPHRTKDEVLHEVYDKYAVDDRRNYALGVLAECDGDIAKRDEYWNKYLQNAESCTAKLVNFLFCADVARRLGMFDKAKEFLQKYKPGKWTDMDKVRDYTEAIVHAIDERDTKRLTFDMLYAYPRD